MAPRLRLNIAKPLPTISEALEDIFEDVTSNLKASGNAYISPNSYSGEEYLQSICELARPTFPVPSENKVKCQNVVKVERQHDSLSILSLDGTTRMISWDGITNTLPNFSPLGGKNLMLVCIQTSPSSEVDSLEDLYSEGQRTQPTQCPNCRENAHVDCPQENFHDSCLYTAQEDDEEKEDLDSFPRVPSVRPMQEESSCPEPKTLKNQSRIPPLKHGPNQKENVPLVINGKSVWLHSAGEIPMGTKILKSSTRGQPLPKERLKSAVCNQNAKGNVSNRKGCLGNFYRDPKVTSRDWISEYQSAWKEAKVRAALLPPISES